MRKNVEMHFKNYKHPVKEGEEEKQEIVQLEVAKEDKGEDE